MMMMMTKPNKSSTGSKSNDCKRAAAPQKRVAPDAPQAVEAPPPAMAMRILAEAEEAEEVAVRAEKIVGVGIRWESACGS
jgi:hypothetical protein